MTNGYCIACTISASTMTSLYMDALNTMTYLGIYFLKYLHCHSKYVWCRMTNILANNMGEVENCFIIPQTEMKLDYIVILNQDMNHMLITHCVKQMNAKNAGNMFQKILETCNLSSDNYSTYRSPEDISQAFRHLFKKCFKTIIYISTESDTEFFQDMQS